MSRRHLALSPLLFAVAQVGEQHERTDFTVVQARNICGHVDGIPLEPCHTIWQLTGSRMAATLGGQVIPPVFRVVLILVLATGLSWFLRRAITRFSRGLKQKALDNVASRTDDEVDGTIAVRTRVTARTDTIGGVLRSVATITIWLIAVLLVLGEVGIELAPLIAGAGVAGLALGFGAQRLVQDFLSGLFMIIEDQYGIGDIVDVGEAVGVIEAVSLRTTRLRDVYGTLWHVPNGEIRRVGNKSQEWSRAVIDVGVAYGADIPKVTEVLKAVADQMAGEPDWTEHFIAEPEVWGVQDFGADEVVMRTVMKVAPAKQWVIERELRARIKAAFDAEGIEIPFPQRTLWIRHDDDGQAAALTAGGKTPSSAKPSKKATGKRTAKRSSR